MLDKQPPSSSPLNAHASSSRLNGDSVAPLSPSAAYKEATSAPLTLNEQMARRFPDIESLSSSSVERAQGKLRADLDSIDGEIDTLMAALRNEHASAKLSDSGGIQFAVRQLFDQLEKIRKKAASSESTVREITGDIRTLDTAKRNIVGSMTAIKRLQMLGEWSRDADARPKIDQTPCTPSQNPELQGSKHLPLRATFEKLPRLWRQPKLCRRLSRRTWGLKECQWSGEISTTLSSSSEQQQWRHTRDCQFSKRICGEKEPAGVANTPFLLSTAQLPA